MYQKQFWTFSTPIYEGELKTFKRLCIKKKIRKSLMMTDLQKKYDTFQSYHDFGNISWRLLSGLFQTGLTWKNQKSKSVT